MYIGVTNDLGQRVVEHYFQKGESKTFTGRYNCNILIYYEGFQNIQDAIAREKQLKKWSREKKQRLVLTMNPKVENLYIELFQKWPPI